LSLRCGQCGGEAFRLETAEARGRVVCGGCGHGIEPPWGPELAEIRADLRSLREEVNRLRQAVNFLNQRVR
jgi:transcription initiation factor TFIIIB Brf1 subunit/transcription initiation factor TFIIB